MSESTSTCPSHCLPGTFSPLLGRRSPRRRWSLVLFLVGGLGLTAAGRAPAGSAHHQAVTAAPPPVVAAPPAKAPPTALLNAADEIARQVAKLRGLPQKTPFSRGVLSRA